MKNTGYQQAIYAKKVSRPGDFPLDVDGNLCSDSRKKQAILLLEGEENPAPHLYEVESAFRYGDVIDGYDTRIYNPEACPLTPEVSVFDVNKQSLSYPVSKDSLGFDITDTLSVSSSVDNRYKEYVITSAPEWITVSKGAVAGVVNTLHLTVKRNRDSDNEKTGTILLTQNDTGNTISIQVKQAGRLTEGIPTEYPYVSRDTVLGNEYSVVQIGEQIWLQRSLGGGHAISQEKIDNWALANPGKYAPALEEFQEVFGSGWTRVRKNDIQNDLLTEAGGTDNGTYHMLPFSTDIKEMVGFIITQSGATDWNSFSQTSLGFSLAKKKLDTSLNGYDDVRITYPGTWIDALDNGKLSDNDVKTGTDALAIGFMTAGIIHPFNAEAKNNPLYGVMEMHLRDQDPTDTNEVNLSCYSLTTNTNNRGIFLRNKEMSAYLARGIRTLRYRPLPFDVYDNGSEIRKINNGDAVPVGFSPIPKGGLRGLWFGNPNLPYNILKDMTGWLDLFMSNLNNRIG